MIGKRGKGDSSSFKVSLFIREETIEIDLNEKLHIPEVAILSPARLCNMMAENPALHARWNVLANEAAIEYDRCQMEFDIWIEEQSKIQRESLHDGMNGKRITDKMVNEAVITDPEYKRKYHEVLNKKRDAANVKSVAYGFGERGERLVNITSMIKSEKPNAYVKNNNHSSDDDETAFKD